MSDRLILGDDVIRQMLERRARAAPVGPLLAGISREIRRTPQTAQRWASTGIGSLLLAVAAGAAVVAVMVLGPGSTPRPGVGTPESPAPSASAQSPSAPASGGPRTVVSVGIDGPVMEGGTWETRTFDHPFTFKVDDDLWVPGADLPRQFYLRARMPSAPPNEFDALTLVSLQNVYVDPCEGGEAGGTRPWDPTGGPQAFFDWLQESSPIDFGTPREAIVLGRQGLELEFTMPDMSECAGGFMPITDVGRQTSFATGMPRQPTRYGVTTVNGQTVLVVTWADDAARWEAVKAAADDVLASVEFLP